MTYTIYDNLSDQIGEINEDWKSLFYEGKIKRFESYVRAHVLMERISLNEFLLIIKKDPGALFDYMTNIVSLTGEEALDKPYYKVYVISPF